MLTTTFRPGQRVVTPSEPQLGLGIVTECAQKRFHVLFPKADTERTYSMDTGAVLRFQAKVGDRITDGEGRQYKVSGVEQEEGIFHYLTEEGETVSEILLSVDLSTSDPMGLLAVGKPGSPATFLARSRAYTLRALGRSQTFRGLGSARVELLPHQLYVAERVAQMWRPRVLLADEVGLGKTIEAGLIGIRLAALGRVQSVAVVAPRALVGQWLAEFYRRFARPLTLFDPEVEELPQDLLIAADDLEFLPADFARELLIVDEAHHFYSEEVLKILAQRSQAVLFLTATPSLGGQDSLFALLHQLDPIRYPDSETLSEHGDDWERVAELARLIEGGGELDKVLERLQEMYPEEPDLVQLARSEETEELLSRLVDRHGLGRSLLRNRRARLQNLFSSRKVVEHQVSQDSFEEFLVDHLRGLSEQGEKCLVMVDNTSEVSHWAQVLAHKTKLSVARFDETMSLLERDRQAAWFNRTRTAPGEEPPASVLICSELGGEGRNFQVAHHLVLLDLPRHPDKLEQRIGRLDRIGQTEEVTVHVPLASDDTTGRVRFAWLHHGLDAFAQPLAEGQTAYQEFSERLAKLEEKEPDTDEVQAFLGEVKEWSRLARVRAERSVDPLIDRMSYQEEKAAALAAQVAEEQEKVSGLLAQELPELLDSLGVNLEPRGDNGLHFVRPGGMMFVESLPGLPPTGALVTFDRELANRRDDVEFLQFEHRLVQNTLDLIIEEGVGMASAARWKGAPRTTVCFQLHYVFEAEGPAGLGLSRYLPTQVQVVSGDLALQVESGCCLPGSGEVEERELERLSKDVVETLLHRTTEVREQLQEKCSEVLAARAGEYRERGTALAHDFFQREFDRLNHLRESEEIKAVVESAEEELRKQQAEVLACLQKAEWRFDAVRMILCQE